MVCWEVSEAIFTKKRAFLTKSFLHTAPGDSYIIPGPNKVVFDDGFGQVYAVSF